LSPELMPLKLIFSSNNSNIPDQSVLKSIDVTLDNNLDSPQAEYGLFTDNDINGKLYLMLVNRVIVDTANINVKINSTKSITAVNILNNNSLGTFDSVDGIVSIGLKLNPGDGIVLRLENILYNKEIEGHTIFSPDLSKGFIDPNDFIAGPGYSIIEDNGKQYLLGDTENTYAQSIIFNNVSAKDFIMTGSFKILYFNKSASDSPFLVNFRDRQQNYFSGLSYSLVLYPDQIDYSSSSPDFSKMGRVGMIRNPSPNWSDWRGYSQQDRHLLQDNSIHSFTIKAYGGRLEAYVDGLKYLDIIDNYVNETGYMGILTYQGNKILYSDIKIKELVPVSEPGCLTNCYFPIDLKPGINMISIPFIPNNNSIDYLFEDVLSNIRRIYSYNPTTSMWEVYIPGQSSLSSLKTIEPRKGYLVFMKNQGSITISGNVSYNDETTPEINAVPGWNLIGVHNTTSKTMAQELGNLNYDSLWKLNSTNEYEQIIDSSTELTNPGSAYWVFIKS
jgi:hypothetical protein